MFTVQAQNQLLRRTTIRNKLQSMPTPSKNWGRPKLPFYRCGLLKLGRILVTEIFLAANHHHQRLTSIPDAMPS